LNLCAVHNECFINDDDDIGVDTRINIDQGNDILDLAYVIEMNTVLSWF